MRLTSCHSGDRLVRSRFGLSTTISTLVIAGVGDAPDRASGVIRDQKRSVGGNRQRRWSAPHLSPALARGPEPSGEVLVVAFRVAVFERHVHHFVAGRHGAIPRAL